MKLVSINIFLLLIIIPLASSISYNDCSVYGNCKSTSNGNNYYNNTNITNNYTNITQTVNESDPLWTANSTLVPYLEKENTFTQPNTFNSNVSLTSDSFQSVDNYCAEGTQFELVYGAPKICGPGWRTNLGGFNNLQWINGNVTGLLEYLYTQDFSEDIYAPVLLFEQDTKIVDGVTYKDAVSGIIFVANNGTYREGTGQWTTQAFSLGFPTEDIYYPSASTTSFDIYGDNLGNNVFSIEGKEPYDVAIGNPSLSYKTNLYVLNGNASISDCIILNGQAICDWANVGNSSWNQGLADTLYYPLNSNPSAYLKQVDLANSGNVTGVLPIANGGTGQSSFASGIIQSIGTSLISNTTARSVWDTAYHSNRANLDTINQNLAQVNSPTFNAMILNGSTNLLNGQSGGLRIYENAYFDKKLFIGGYNEFGQFASITGTMNQTTSSIGFQVNMLENYSTAPSGVGADAYQTSVVSIGNITGTYQLNGFAVYQACDNVNPNVTCMGFKFVQNTGHSTNASLVGVSVSTTGSTANYGNKAYFSGAGGLWFQSAGSMTPRFITPNTFDGSLIVKNSIESVEGNVYARQGLFQTFVNYPNPGVIARANYDEFGNRMAMNVSTVENRFNQTVWAVDDLGNEYVQGDLAVTGNITGNNYYGEMWNKTDGGFETIDLVTSEVYVKVKSLTCGNLNGFTCVNGNLTNTFAGMYRIDAVASVSATSVGGEYGMKIFVGETGQNNCYSHAELPTTATTMSISCFVRINAGNRTTIRFDDHANPVRDIAIDSMNVNMLRIGN